MGFVPEQVIFIPIRHRLRVRRAGPCGVRAPGDQIYWDESKESFTDFLALNRAARARALGQGMPLAESSSRLATSWARLGHACARLGPQQLRVGGSKRKAPSRSLPLPSGSFHLPQWDFVACWADSAFPKGDSARHRGDSDPPGATRGADSAHAGPTRSAEWEHGRPTHSPHSDPPLRRGALAGSDSPLRVAPAVLGPAPLPRAPPATSYAVPSNEYDTGCAKRAHLKTFLPEVHCVM